jgi:hypothetical protein
MAEPAFPPVIRPGREMCGGPPGNIVRKQIQVGSTVVVRLYDGCEVEAKITKIIDSVADRKVHIAFGVFTLMVTETQIIRTREE